MLVLVALSDGQMTLIDQKYYIDVVNAGPWHPDQHGYAQRYIWINKKRTVQKLHQFIARFIGITGNIDHKDLDGLNNTEQNLRPATHSQNKMNQRACRNNKLGVKGVWKEGKKFRVKLIVNGINKYTDSFETLEEAKEAYCRASIQYHQEYGRTE